MAYEEFLHSITLEADASLAVFTGVAGLPGAPANPSGNQYRFVKVTGEHQVGIVSATTDEVVGVLQNKPQGTGHAATVGVFGVSQVEAAGAVAAGAIVTPAADGRATTGGTKPVGIALHSSAAAGELIPVLLRVQ